MNLGSGEWYSDKPVGLARHSSLSKRSSSGAAPLSSSKRSNCCCVRCIVYVDLAATDKSHLCLEI